MSPWSWPHQVGCKVVVESRETSSFEAYPLKARGERLRPVSAVLRSRPEPPSDPRPKTWLA